MKGIVLPFSKSLHMAYRSLRVRFLRSLITAMSLVLAVSFLSYTLSTNSLNQELFQHANFAEILAKKGFQATISAKERWIVALSLLVCIVGIINAQLMAVTERFREIGTLKCLGALDHFIVRLFLLEALIQGFFGALVGSLLGFFFATLSALFHLGFSALPIIFSPTNMLPCLWATLFGVSLSIIGALYPAWIAAKMQPVEAMRAE